MRGPWDDSKISLSEEGEQLKIRASKLAALLNFAQTDGVDVRRILHDVSIQTDILTREDFLIDAADSAQLIECLADACSDDFSFRNGVSLNLLNEGIVGHAILSAQTMNDVVGLWVKYSDVSGHPLTFKSYLEEDYWVLEMMPRFAMPEKAFRFVLQNTISSHAPLGYDTAGPDFGAVRYELTIPSAGQDDLYAEWITAPVRFDCSRNRILMDKAYYERPIATADVEVLRICEERCQQILQNIDAETQYASQIKSMFLSSGGEIPSEQNAASILGLSVRSLRRKLGEEGFSYQQLLNDYRRDSSFELLREKSLRPKEIAHVLGYSNPNSFRRAFKSWTGLAISEWVERHTGS